MADLSTQRSPNPHTESPTILLVEDEARVRKGMAQVLTMECYTVMESATAEHALAQLEHNIANVAMLISDVMFARKGRATTRT